MSLRILLLAALIIPLSGTAQAQEPRVIDEIVAVVDDDILLRSDINGFVYNVMQQQRVAYSEQLWFDALNSLIDQKVMAVHARRDTTLTILPEEVTYLLDERINQMASSLGGQANLENLYGKPLAQIKVELRSDFEDQMLAERFQARRVQRIRVTPAEVKSWFDALPADSLPMVPETVRLSHIVRFPDVTAEARESARSILSTIRDSIVAGQAFEEYARRYSDDPGSADRGGHYENARLGIFVAEFAAVVSRSPIGEVSEIFESRRGLHIVRVNERRGDIIDLNQILIQFDRDQFDASSAIATLEAVRDSIVNQDKSFAAMAREYSEEESSAAAGGRVTDPRTGDRNLVFDALGPTWKLNLSDIEPGGISEPAEVQLLDGRQALHIVLLQERIPEHRVDLNRDYELISNFALREKQAREIGQWVEKLREDVYVEVRATRSADSLSLGPSGR